MKKISQVLISAKPVFVFLSLIKKVIFFVFWSFLLCETFAAAPTSYTVPANRVTYTGANLNCRVNPNSETTTISFEYGLTASYGSTATVSGTSTGSSIVFKKSTITGLLPGRTYHYRVKAVNGSGTVNGSDRTFVTGSNFNSGSANGHQTLTVGSDGMVYAFGRGGYGELGDGANTDRSAPVRVLKGAYNGTTYLGDNAANPIIAVAAGEYHGMALAADGTVYTFGYNYYGQLGDNSNTNGSVPVQVLKGDYNGTTYLGDNSANPIVSVACGDMHSMALAANGTVFTVGWNGYKQLGDGTTTDRTTPVQVLKGAYNGTTNLGDNSANPIISLAGGYGHSLVMAADGTVFGFGANNYGQLGDSTQTNRSTPIQALKGEFSGTTYFGDNTSNPIIAIAAGWCHTIALAADGTVFSLGLNHLGQLGNDTVIDEFTPIQVHKGNYSGTTYLGDNSANPIVAVTAGRNYCITLAADGTVFTFGWNSYGQLGNNTTDRRSAPVRVLKGAYSGTTYLGDNTSNPIIAIAAGEEHSITLASDGNLFPFGANGVNQLGDNTGTSRYTPIKTTGVGSSGYLDLIGCSGLNSLPSVLATTYTGSYKETDAAGWTHYCTSDNQLLLSLKIGSSGAVVNANEVALKTGNSTTFSSSSSGGMITNSNGYAIIDRRWNVTPTTQPSNGNVGVKYYFTNTEYTAEVAALAALSSATTITNANQLQMYKATSGSAYADPHTVNGIVLTHGSTPGTTVWKWAQQGTSDHSAEFEVASFSGGGGGGGGGNAPLPVTLILFTGKLVNANAVLNWTTATEINNDHFDIERSYNGDAFIKVGEVIGSGTHNQLKNYTFTDNTINKLSADKFFYRLKQVDFDGQLEYSHTILVNKNEISGGISIYPNPASTFLTIGLNNPELFTNSIQILGTDGKTYLQAYSQTQSVGLDISSLAKGIYYLKISASDNSLPITVQKIIIQ